MSNRPHNPSNECPSSQGSQVTRASAMSAMTLLKPSAIFQKRKKKTSAEGKKPPKRYLPPKRIKLQEGEQIQSECFTWKMVKLLGAGGFGDVYKVVKVENLDKDEYAMKTEIIGGDRRMLRLKVEVAAMKECLDEPNPDRKRHFVALVDRGITAKFKFLVMELVGPSLEDIRRNYLGRNFSRSTSMNVALQSLQAIADFHHLGWLHRDIKPANFAAGIKDKEHVVYILDFGIAKKIFKPNSREVVTARSRVRFLGTLRFASRACHSEMDQGRKDDVETWIYMVFDLLDYSHGLPWKRMREKKEVAAAKEKFFKHYTYRKVPEEFSNILKLVNGLTYKDEPKYEDIAEELMSICKTHGIKPERQQDWVGKLKKKKKKHESSSSSDTSSDNKQSGSGSDTTEEKSAKGSKRSKESGKVEQKVEKRTSKSKEASPSHLTKLHK